MRNYVTEGLTKRTGTALAKSPGSYSCKGVSYGSLPWNVQVARCLSGQSSSGNYTTHISLIINSCKKVLIYLINKYIILEFINLQQKVESEF